MTHEHLLASCRYIWADQWKVCNLMVYIDSTPHCWEVRQAPTPALPNAQAPADAGSGAAVGGQP